MSAGGIDAFISKFGTTGNHLFSKTLGSTGTDQLVAVAIDANDNIVLLGAFSGTVDFGGPTPLTSSDPSTDIFMAKFSPAGAHKWSKAFGSSGAELAIGLTVNQAGDVAVVGRFCGTISLGGDPLSSASACTSNDVFAARFAGGDGGHLNSVRAGGMGSEDGIAVAQGVDGRFYVTGDFEDFADFAGETLTSRGDLDAFVLALAPL